jgi:UDPglucose 6-dehydrogenase
LGGLRGKRIALLGLAFKGGTDDVRESRAIPIAEILMAAGATVLGYDPVANASFARVVPNIALVESVQDALRDADACLLLAEWPEFSQLDGHDFLVSMQNPLVLDGRRILDPDRMVDVRFRRIG